MSHGSSRGSSSTTPPRAARHRLLRLRRAIGCLGMSRGSSRGSSSTTLPRSLFVDYFAYAVRPGASACRAARLMARHRLLCLAPLVVDYFAYAVRPGASARHVACHAARRQLLRLRRVSECLGTLRGSSHGTSRGSLSTSSPTPRVRVPWHVAWLVVTTSPAPRVRVPRHVVWLVSPLIVDYAVCRDYLSRGNTGSTSATSCVATTCLAATLALLRVRHVLPQRCLLVASHRPFISTSFPN
jgi:hypothetical protein